MATVADPRAVHYRSHSSGPAFLRTVRYSKHRIALHPRELRSRHFTQAFSLSQSPEKLATATRTGRTQDRFMVHLGAAKPRTTSRTKRATRVFPKKNPLPLVFPCVNV